MHEDRMHEDRMLQEPLQRFQRVGSCNMRSPLKLNIRRGVKKVPKVCLSLSIMPTMQIMPLHSRADPYERYYLGLYQDFFSSPLEFYLDISFIFRPRP